jgi:hypothetical protein
MEIIMNMIKKIIISALMLTTLCGGLQAGVTSKHIPWSERHASALYRGTLLATTCVGALAIYNLAKSRAIMNKKPKGYLRKAAKFRKQSKLCALLFGGILAAWGIDSFHGVKTVIDF